MLKKYFTFLLLFCAVMHGAENYPGKLKRQDGRIFLEIHGKEFKDEIQPRILHKHILKTEK